MNYLNYWHLNKPLFTQTAQEDPVFTPKQWLNLFKHIETFITSRLPILVLQGEHGVGKTTFLAQIYRNLMVQDLEILPLSPLSHESESGWLMPRISEILGLQFDNKGISPKDLMQKTMYALDRQFLEKGKRLLIMIDGVERLTTTRAFAEIEGLINVDTMVQAAGQSPQPPMITFLLSGTPKILEMLTHVEALQKRIGQTLALKGLSKDEALDYIHFTESKLSHKQEIFTSQAVRELHRLSENGIFSLFNMLAEKSLVAAAKSELTRIDENAIKNAESILESSLENRVKDSPQISLDQKIVPEDEHKVEDKKRARKKKSEPETPLPKKDARKSSQISNLLLHNRKKNS